MSMMLTSLTRGLCRHLRFSHVACLTFLVNNVNTVVFSASLLQSRQDTISSNLTPFSDQKMLSSSQATSKPIPDVLYEELRKLLNAQTVLLVDVREPKELRDDGKIPGSINVPLGEVETALQLPSDKFSIKYEGSLPSKEKSDELIMTCRSGKRATTAVEIARKLGFSDARCYCGSFLDWVKNGGPVEKP